MLEDKRKKIEVINRGRATGRTTELIRRCAKHNYALIVTPSMARARSVFEQARSQGIYIPFPITFKEFCRGDFYGRNVDAFFFDDLDASLKELAMWAPIEAVVIEGDETTNTGDIINREAAINEITEYGDSNVLYMSVREARRRLENLPSAQPEIIRCRDCVYYDPPHVDDNGERREYKDMPNEAFDVLGTGLVSVEYGINVGGRCARDYNAMYSEDKRVFVGEDNYCGRAERRTDG